MTKSRNAAPLKAGKLPLELLSAVLEGISTNPTILQGPGAGLDCAVIDIGSQLLVVKSDPITFTAANIGWYAVHVNANDIATTGAKPSWFMATLLLPEHGTDEALVHSIFGQIDAACISVGAVLAGGHTEITAGLNRLILSGTMIGTTTRDQLRTPAGIQSGDHVLLTKGIPIEAASILAVEFSDRLRGKIPAGMLERAAQSLYEPGLSVLPEARIASGFPTVHAMHDPTEGGLAGALWEFSLASGKRLNIDPEAVHLLPEGVALCSALGIDPWQAIASGALLLAVAADGAPEVLAALAAGGIPAADIGFAEPGSGVFLQSRKSHSSAAHPLPFPERDALAVLFEAD